MLQNSFSASFAALRSEVAKIAVCPICRGGLDWEETEISCKNPNCRRRFRVTSGIPVLADEDKSAISFDPVKDVLNKSALKSKALSLLPALDLNIVPQAVKDRLRREIFAMSQRPIVLNVGGKHPTSFTQGLCAEKDVVAIECDLAYRARTRIFADPSRIPLADASVDAVLLDGLLEHVPHAEAAVSEAYRVLKPNGILYADTPFMLPVHGGAFDYARFSHQAQRILFRRFDELESGVSSGPGVALTYSIQYFLLCLCWGKSSRYFVKTFCRISFFWIKYLDLFIATRPAALDAAHGLYFLGRKSDKISTDREIVSRYEGRVPHLYLPETEVSDYRTS